MAWRLTALVVALCLGTVSRALDLRSAGSRRPDLPSEAPQGLRGSDGSDGSLIALTSRASACGHEGGSEEEEIPIPLVSAATIGAGSPVAGVTRARPGASSTTWAVGGGRSRRVAWGECSVCNLVPFERPTLYAKERADGCGARLQEIISWAGVAARNKLNFGGVVTNGICQESHGADVFRAVSAILGLKSPTDLFIQYPPKFDREYKGLNDFHKKFANGDKTMKEYVPMGDVLVRDNCLACELDSHNLSEFLSPKLLFFLRSESRLGGIYNNMTIRGRRENRPVVAVHVRRGDVRPGTPFSLFTNEHDYQRLSPDDWYYEVVGRILKVLPNADVHVFSSTENKYSASDFDGFRQRNMTVHLDGDILDDWAVMAHAKVLVMAKSAFSHVPAYLNTNCILFQPWWHMPLDGWILARDANGTGSEHSSRGEPFFDTSELRRCLARADRLNQA